MKKNHFLLLLLFVALQFNGFAQNEPVKINVPGLEVPPLIFSEIRMDNDKFSYVELTNVGNQPIDLHNFTLSCIYKYSRYTVWTATELQVSNGFEYTMPLAPTRAVGSVSELPAGESIVLMQVFDRLTDDGFPEHKLAMLDKADYYFHVQERGNPKFLNKPEWQSFDKDSVETGFEGWKSPIGMGNTSGYLLKYRYVNAEGNEDFAYVDQFNVSADTSWNNGAQQGVYKTPIAGNPNALIQCISVRKANITQGNMDWHDARGENLESAEWMPIPYTNSKFDVFTTVGNHGDFQLDYTVKEGSGIEIDEENAIIKAPWNVQRGDSLSHFFNIAPGMAWSYELNGQDTDSAFVNVHTGDKFTFYAAGSELKTKEFTVQVKEPTADLAVAFGRNIKTDSIWESKYLVSNGNIVDGVDSDSITNVPFALRTDSLVKYLYKPEGATWEFIFVDGQQRVDLEFGDILRVTSADGTKTKDYIISVDEIILNANADLSSITWPDVDESIYWEFLKGDTLPDFEPSKLNYQLILKNGTKNIPALQFKTAHTNASYTVKHATNLFGSKEERTTRVSITAPDGKTQKEYSICFVLEGNPIQPNRAEPFFAEFVIGWGYNGMAVEIFNPGTEVLDLKGYMIVRGINAETPQTSISKLTTSPMNQIYKAHYAPGYRWRGDDQDAWTTADQGYLRDDEGAVNTLVKPQDVFVMGSGSAITPHMPKNIILNEFDMIFTGKYLNTEQDLNPWGIELHKNYTPSYFSLRDDTNNSSLYLLKILNDSITNGLKTVQNINDYKIIDRFQRSPNDTKMWVGGIDLCTQNGNAWQITRKPSVYKGVTGQAEGLGDNEGKSAENCEWYVHNARENEIKDITTSCIGFHIMDPLEKHLSTITSNYYKVSKGYEGNLTITGSVNDVFVSDMENLLTRSDEEQIFEFMDGTTPIASDATIQENMVLIVTSPNLVNSSIYTFVQSPLDDNNLLVANAGSNLTVSKTGLEGIISGVAMGATLRSVIEDLSVPANAILNVLDDKGNLASLKALNYDTIYIDRIASPNLTLEVVAENGDRANYSLDFGHTTSDAVLFSDVITIDRENKILVNAPENIDAVSILTLIYANKGAEVKIVDKAGFERQKGLLNIDDQVFVLSEDQSRVSLYNITFTTPIDFSGLNNSINDFERLYEEAFYEGYNSVKLTEGYNAIRKAKDAKSTVKNQDDVTAAILELQDAIINFQTFNVTSAILPENAATIAGATTYNYGQIATLIATPSTGYGFANWTDGVTEVSQDAVYTFTVTENRGLVANFEILTFNVTPTILPENKGAVTGTTRYNYNQIATLTATPSTGYNFTNWTDGTTEVSQDAIYTFTVTENHSLVANFEIQTFNITAAILPENKGSLTGATTYDYNQVATLSATPSTGYSFANWTDGVTEVSQNAIYTFTVTENRSLVANFEIQTFNITAETVQENKGSLSGANTYNYGQIATLTATPSTGYSFANWTDGTTEVSQDAVYTFAVTENRGLVANFEIQTFNITAAILPENKGSLTGATTYDYNQIATLTATPSTGYDFTNWTDGATEVSQDAVYTFAVTEPRSLVANFEIQNFDVSVTTNSAALGSVSNSDTYNYGEIASVTASSVEGADFIYWLNNNTEVSANKLYSFEVTEAISIEAVFATIKTVTAEEIETEITIVTNEQSTTVTVSETLFEEFELQGIVTYTATLADGSPLPNWIQFDPATLTFTVLPSNNKSTIDERDVDVRIIARDEAGKVEVAHISLTVEILSSVTELEQIEIKLYPNPSTVTLYISSSTTITNIEFVNLAGQTIKSVGVDGLVNNEISVADLSKGIYLVKIFNNTELIKTAKIVKQ